MEGGTKIGGGIYSKVILVPQKILNKMFNFWINAQCLKNTQQVYSRTGTRYIFFYITMFALSVVIGMNE